jgi:hypothetical protein
MKTWRSKKAIVVLTVVALNVPVPIPISQTVSVTIIDKFGRPVVENAVRQDWEYRTVLITRRNSEVKQTDRNGYIHFPRRYYWYSVAGKVFDWVENILSMGHGGYGTKASLDIYGSEPESWPCGIRDSLPDRIRLEEMAQTNFP